MLILSLKSVPMMSEMSEKIGLFISCSPQYPQKLALGTFSCPQRVQNLGFDWGEGDLADWPADAGDLTGVAALRDLSMDILAIPMRFRSTL